jgi:uncharacterized protein YdeI (YjbR/CyaY-like superfamily)
MVHTDAVFFEDDEAFETWLVHNASTATHVWVRMAKKGTGVTSIDWARAVDVALCFGWIDGISRRLDDKWYVQRFTPRRAKSVWSKNNRERIEGLTAEGRMGPAGLAEVERAKADGRWAAAYDGSATAVVPDDLAAALAARDLTDVYAALDSRNRFAFLNRALTTDIRSEEGILAVAVDGKPMPSATTGEPSSVRVVAFSPRDDLPVTVTVPGDAEVELAVVSYTRGLDRSPAEQLRPRPDNRTTAVHEVPDAVIVSRVVRLPG